MKNDQNQQPGQPDGKIMDKEPISKNSESPLEEPEICPECGSKAWIPIAYGFPVAEMWEAYERGEIALGGCLVRFGQPTARCRECDCDYRPEEFLTEKGEQC